MKSIIIVSLFIFSMVFAIPSTVPNYCRPSSKTYIAQYDDLKFNEGEASPIPSPYKGLVYTLFQVDQYDGFIPPTSGNQWTMAYGGSGNISVQSSPPKQTLALSSFSYACVAGIPQAECAISVWGWKSSGRLIKRVITYPRLDPGHVIEDFKMNRTTFSREWQDLTSVGFSIARADNGGDVYGGLALDDVMYTVTKGC